MTSFTNIRSLEHDKSRVGTVGVFNYVDGQLPVARMGLVALHEKLINQQPLNDCAGYNHYPQLIDNYINKLEIIPSAINIGNISVKRTFEYYVSNSFLKSANITNVKIEGDENTSYTGHQPSLKPFNYFTVRGTVDSTGVPNIYSKVTYGSDVSLPVTFELVGSRIRLLKLKPTTPYTLSLNFNTSVINSYSGVEQRVSRSKYPRLDIKSTYIIDRDDIDRINNANLFHINSYWTIPLQMYPNKALFKKGVSEIDCDTTTYEYVSKILVVQVGDELFPLSYSKIENNKITLDEPFTHRDGDYIFYPCAVGFVEKVINDYRDGISPMVDIDFKISSVKTYHSIKGFAESFKNIELISDEHYFNTQTDDQKIGYYRDLSILEKNDVFETYSTNRKTRITMSVEKITQTIKEAFEFRQWVYRRMGSRVPFYMPTFKTDVNVILESKDVVIGNFIRFYEKDFSDNGLRYDLFIKTKKGFVTTTMTNIVVDDYGIATATLDQPLNMKHAEIIYVSYLNLLRVNVDQIDFDYIGGGVCSTQVRLIEVI